jgi:sugar lactone lactonase YvrE
LQVVAGNGRKGYSGDGGPAREAELNEPYEVRFDAAGNMYFVEMQNHLVRRVDAQSGLISTVAGTGSAGYSGDGGPARQARLSSPHSIALDDRGGLYIADIGNHRIRKVNLQTGQIDSLAGSENPRLPTEGQVAKDTPVLGPRALFIQGRTLWVALREGHSVWKLDLDRPVWRHVAGTGKQGYSGDGGPPGSATFNGPKGIALGPSGSIFVVDTENHAIRAIDGAQRQIRTVAGGRHGSQGDGGPAVSAAMDRPHGICVAPDGTLYIGDTSNHRVRSARAEDES